MPKKNGLILSIDVGTSRCKAALFKTNGEPMGFASTSYSIKFSQNGRVEADAVEDWWKPTIRNIKELIKKTKGAPSNIIAVGVSCTNGIVPVNDEGKPVGNAIMQFDKRTTELVGFYSKKLNDEELFEITGNRLAAGSYALPTIVWLKENAKDVYKKAASFLYPSGYIASNLTGKFSIDYTRAATTLFYDMQKKIWSTELLNFFSVKSEKLPQIFSSSDVIGTVTKSASRETGLPEGIPVIAGAMDTYSAVVGLDKIKHNDTSLILGTVARLCKTVMARGVLKSDFTNIECGPKKFLSIACMDGIGTSYKWFNDAVGSKGGTGGTSADVTSLDPCSGGLIYLPYLVGERSPVWDPYVKGVLFGIEPGHRREHIYRAIIEGCGFAVRSNIEIMSSEAGLETGTLVVPETGFGNYPEWLQTISDITGCEINTVKIEDPECTGTAALAAIGAGEAKDTSSFVKKSAKSGKKYKPSKERKKAYDSYFIIYNKLYTDLKGDFRILKEIRNSLR